MSRPCKGNFDRLLGLMDGSLRPRAAESLRKHMEGCPGCATAFRRLQSTKRLCREAATDELPELNWTEIETKIHWRTAREERKAPRRSFWQPALALTGSAAVGALITALVMFGMGERTAPAPSPGPPPARVAVKPTPAPAACPALEDRAEGLSALPTLLQGEVYLLTASGLKTPMELNRPLFGGDRAITYKGKAALQWSDGTGLRMTPQAEVELKELTTRDQEMVLWQGKIYLEVAKRKEGQNKLAVLSQGLRVSVKGTHLSVARQGDNLVVEVFRGSVVVAPQDGRWKGVEVPAGFALAAPLDGEGKPQMDRLPVDAISFMESVSRMNLVPWTGLKEVLGGTGPMQVTSKPAGAKLHLNSLKVGTTDIMLRRPYRNHLIELYKNGRLIQKKWVNFTPSLKTVALRGKPAGHMPRVRKASQIPEVSAALGPASIRIKQSQVQRCYERRLKQNPKLKGTLEIVISVDGDGRVLGTRLGRKGTIRDRYLERCALSVAQAWRFAPAKDKRPYDVSFPIALAPR